MPEHQSRRIRSPVRDIYPVGRPPSALGPLAVGIVVIAALYFAHEIFVPLALAVLLSFALGPLVMVLRRWHFGRVPSVAAAVLLAFLVVLGVGSLIGGQLARLAENLPQYQSNMTSKIHALRDTATENGIVARASAVLKDLSSAFAKPTPPPPTKAPSAAARAAQAQAPIPVEIRQPEPTTVEIIQTIVGPLLQPLATTGIVFVFVVFFLLQREDLRDRFIRLAGARDLHRTTRRSTRRRTASAAISWFRPPSMPASGC